MKKENFDYQQHFFLFSNGDVIYAPNGLRKKDFYFDKQGNVKVLAFEYNDDGVKKSNVEIDIVYATNSITAIEEREKNYFINTSKKINYYFRNLGKVDHEYKPEDMPEHVQELINFNRLRIIRRWKISESLELRRAYGNTFDI